MLKVFFHLFPLIRPYFGLSHRRPPGAEDRARQGQSCQHDKQLQPAVISRHGHAFARFPDVFKRGRRRLARDNRSGLTRRHGRVSVLIRLALRDGVDGAVGQAFDGDALPVPEHDGSALTPMEVILGGSTPSIALPL